MRKKQIIIYTIITIIFFGMLYKLEYATDTYQVFIFNAKEIFNQFAMSGRFLTGTIGAILKIIETPNEVIYIVSYILAMICTILSQYKIYKIIEREIESKILKTIIPTLIVINPFSIELFLFIEKGIMLFGVLMCIYALDKLIKYFETKKKRNIIYSILFMLVANFSYQGIVGIFVGIALVYILKHSKNIRQFIINNIITALIYGIPAIIDYVIVKILYPKGRISGQIVISESLEKIYGNTIYMAKFMYNLLPKYLFILAICFTFGILWCKIIKNKSKILEILKYLYIVIGTIVITALPQLMQPTSAIWFVARSTYTYGALYGILILYLSLNYKIDKKLIITIFTISLVLLGFQLQKFIEIENDRYSLNQKDYEITMQIIDEIKQYEEDTNNKIEKIAIYEDESPGYTYPGIFATGDTNVKAFIADWSTKAILEYYLERELTQIEKEEEINKEFLQKNWNQFELEQIKLEEDIIILCRY